MHGGESIVPLGAPWPDASVGVSVGEHGLHEARGPTGSAAAAVASQIERVLTHFLLAFSPSSLLMYH